MNKKILFIISCVVVGIIFICSVVKDSVSKIEKSTLSIFKSVPDKVNALPNYEAQLNRSLYGEKGNLPDIEHMTWEQYRQQRANELHYELGLIRVARSGYKTLQDKGMFGE